MAGIALVLDLMRKKSSLYSTQSLHSYGLCSATAAASAAAVSVVAGTSFASRALFGNFGIGVAHCDAGPELTEDYLSNIHSASERIFQNESLKYSTKEYNIELKPLFSVFEWRVFAMTTLRSFLMYYLPLMESRSNMEGDDEDFLQDAQEQQPVDLVVPLKKSVKQVIWETTVVTTRQVLERAAVHYVP